ncbi:MAG: hypothetical protein AB7V08_10830 [Elusimicrobiales bacterium]
MKFITTALILSVFSAPAAAMHPLISEDTGFLGRDVRQVELGLDHSVERQGPDTYSTTGSAEISYGLFDRVDLLLSAPWQGWTSHGLSRSGVGDVSLEAKFGAGRAAGWDLALKPGFSLPAGDEGRSLGAGKGGVWLYGVAGRTDGPRQYYLNTGFLLNRNSVGEEEHILKASAAGLLEVFPKVMISAELAAETNTDPSSVSHPVTSVFGLIWSPYPALDLDAGVSLGLTRPAPDLGLLLGLTLRL